MVQRNGNRVDVFAFRLIVRLGHLDRFIFQHYLSLMALPSGLFFFQGKFKFKYLASVNRRAQRVYGIKELTVCLNKGFKRVICKCALVARSPLLPHYSDDSPAAFLFWLRVSGWVSCYDVYSHTLRQWLQLPSTYSSRQSRRLSSRAFVK